MVIIFQKYLKEKGIGSKCLVSFKESNNKDVFEILMPKIGNKHEFSVNFIKMNSYLRLILLIFISVTVFRLI